MGRMVARADKELVRREAKSLRRVAFLLKSQSSWGFGSPTVIYSLVTSSFKQKNKRVSPPDMLAVYTA